MLDEGAADMADLLHISRLGAQGDGIAETPDGPVYVGYTLPGEEVRAVVAEGRGRLVEVVRASGVRISPPCPLFSRCGGCAVQHMARAAYLDWKHDIVLQALRARALAGEVDPVREIGERTRRRAVFAARRTRKTVQFGFHAPRAHGVIDLADCDCRLLHPAIMQAVPGLKQLVAPLLSRRGEIRISVTLAENGLDVVLGDVARELSAEQRRALAADATALGILRFSIAGEVIASQAEPLVNFAAVGVPLPVGTFLQASAEADRIMADLVLDALAQSRHVLDLFCGLGTLSLAIARRARVTAIDSDRDAIAALARAVRLAQGLKPLQVRVRDLFCEALADKELAGFDAVVFDPPRAGARRQAEALAASDVPLVIALSCNPATLARDLRILVDGGYRLQRVMPIDQFLYSAHVEAVAVLRRQC